VPIIVEAPGRVSTSTVWPQFSCMRCAISRPSTSTEPPGGNGTMILIARSGYLSAADCACAGAAARHASAAAHAKPTRLRIVSFR
jgi:hypothetical protein